MSKYICGIDMGGTFTDFVSFNTETQEVEVWKNLSTPKQPINGLLTGLNNFDDLTSVGQIRHGTTIATNAILERKGEMWHLLQQKALKMSHLFNGEIEKNIMISVGLSLNHW